jgi:acyl-CoA synthetase (AMP-forming)/AMP-acid ligase II
MNMQCVTDSGEPDTFVDLFCRQAMRKADQTAFNFFTRISDSSCITYHQLWCRSAALAQQLSEKGLEGERVLLVVTNSRNFVAAFFACLMAGAVAVPAPSLTHKRQRERLHLLASNARVKAVIGEWDKEFPLALDFYVHTFNCRTFWSDQANTEGWAARWRPPALSSASLAFLQYTSGSTGDPKGVMVTHGNLIANCKEITLAYGFSESSKMLVPLPLFHDMGLILGVMVPIFNGAEGYFLSPVALVQHPQWWLQLISRYRITTSGAPNFMFDLVSREVTDEQLEGVDLSSWEIAFCGAEPIRASTMTSFAERLASRGFKESSLDPCYGMAEATVFITGSEAGKRVKIDHTMGSYPVVACGFPRLGTCVRIVDPETRRKLGDGVEGEVWVSGDSVATGYWEKPETTEDTFRAFIADSNEGPFLRTGDLGILKDGELYITGRLKDIIIIRGKKYAPQDIEQEAECSHKAIQPTGCVAFGIEREGTEDLVLVVELRRTWLRRIDERPAILKAIKTAVHSAFQLIATEIVFVLPRSIPRTSSGKLRRGKTRVDFIGQCLKSVPGGMRVD